MVMFLVMGLVIIVALGVVGCLFYFMQIEAEKKEDGQAVLITDISELKGQAKANGKEVRTIKSGLLSQPNDDLSEVKTKLAALERDKNVLQEPSPSSSVPASKPIDQLASGEIKFSNIVDVDKPSQNVSVEESRLQEKVKELELQLKLIGEKAVHQAEEAVKVIETLIKENEELKAKQGMNLAAGSLGEEATRSILELKERNGILENQLDLSSAKISQLETQMVVIKKEMGQQLIEANAAIARLKVENEAQDRVDKDSLLKEKQEIQEWREKISRQLREMEDTLMQAKEESLLLKDTKKLLEAKLAVLEDDYKKELAQAKELVSNLTEQKQTQTQRADELEQNIAKLKDLNSTLIEKAKILQYELNRQRTQATGLERVCANFKSQMEGLFGQIEETKKSNNRLLQERINLEAGFASLQSENSKLVERDQVYQQELEKTREQINRFEKIYNNFKSNVNDASKDKPTSH